MAYPAEFQTRMEQLLGEDAHRLFASLEAEPCRALRYNQALLTQEGFSSLMENARIKPVPFVSNGFYFSLDGIGNTPLHHGGGIYVQEPAAMAPVAALGDERVHAVLDLCSAPGGKSLQAAERILDENGILICNEPSPQRRRALMQNLERLGEKRCLVTGFDATHLPKELYGFFDLVITDAPCSGEGMMRKNETAAEAWNIENVLSLAALQAEILESAAKAVKNGGRILYSTCTWAKEENEDNVTRFLESHPEFISLPPDPAVACCAKEGLVPNTLRFYPHIFDGEGQFLAIFKRESGAESPYSPKKKKEKGKKPDPRINAVEKFLAEVLEERPEGALLFRDEDVYLIKDTPFPEELFVSPGVLIGSVQKGRVIPHHRFFRAYAANFRNRISLPYSDPRVEAYLRGEEISLEGNGYGVLFADTLPLGGVKCSAGRGKNYYPKGLRKL
ncbi:MAG: hypothetical protein E7580_07535 [Ruminococcaceae bacterium]|nr:hypothetical protein [Oscillospiraceae bacterium]